MIDDKPNLKDLVRELRRVANECEYIGFLLGIEDRTLAQIKQYSAGNSKVYLREILRVWLRRAYPPPSWSAIVEPLELLEEESLAAHLTAKYCQ